MNNYHIYEAVGRGKHSVVYKGRKKHTISYYAIKSVDKDQKPRVLQEVKAMHVLDNQGVLKFFAWYETTNHLWLILEYCVGGSLLALLKQDMSLPETSIHDFARDLVSSLTYLHNRGFIYCDLKPSNVLLDENGRLKLGGFGLSRKLTEINRQAQAGQPLPTAKHGTPVYMAPELFMEGAIHSTRSDIWSLGCVLYEMASGRPPFVAPTLAQLVSDILHSEPAPLQGNSPAFQDLVSRMLDKNPATRIAWHDIVKHPFWKAPITLRDIPAEPALDAFIRRHGLAPEPAPMGAEDPVRRSRAQAADARRSVDVFRISQIASRNVEKEQGDADAGGDYGKQRTGAGGGAGPGGHARVQGGDVALDNTDAELDFEERADAEEEETALGSSEGARPSSQPAGSGVPSSVSTSQPGPRDASQASSARAALATAPASVSREAGGVGGTRRERREMGLPGEPPGPGPGTGAGQAAPLQRAESVESTLSQQAARMGSPSVVDARPSATPQLGLNPRAGKRGEEAGEADESAAGGLGVGVRGNLESMGAARGDVRLDDVVWHASDMVVKPIVGNRRIERVPEPRWDPGSLPFKPLSLQEVLMAPAASLETFLQQIYAALSSSSAMTDKINILAYFESLCGDAGTANFLINSTLMSLFVRMLRTVRHDRLRVRLCSVIGRLVRHATYIADELAATGVLEVVAEALKDPAERVRRRAMGALGELLFFCATQQHDRGAGAGGSGADGDGDTANGVGGEGEGEGRGAGGAGAGAGPWEVPGTVLSQVVRTLRPGEDEVTQHYALKAIENIATQGGDWGTRVATPETAFLVAQIMSSTKQDALRGTAASTLCRLCRVQPALLAQVFDKWGVRLFVQGLTDTSSKSQGASATMLSLAAASEGLQSRVRTQLLDDRQLSCGLLHLLSSPLPVLQAKAVITTGLLCRQSLGFLARLGPKAFDRLEKLSREREPYLRAALAAFRNEIAEQLGTFLTQAADDLAALTKRRFASGGSTRAAVGAGQPRSPIHQMTVLPSLLLSPALRSAAVSPDLVTRLAAFATAVTSPGVSFTGLPEFRESLVQTMAALQEHAPALVGASGGPRPGGDGASEAAQAAPPPAALVEATATALVPALAEVVGNPEADSEMRFASVSLLSDVVLTYLSRQSHAGAGPSTDGTQPPPHPAPSPSMERALESRILPLLPGLLEERGSDLMPLNALKIFVALMDAGGRWLPAVQSLGVVPRFFAFLSLDSPNNNVHNLRICRALVVGGALSLPDAARLSVASRVHAVLSYAHDNAVEPFLEPVLDLCCSLLERDQHARHADAPGAGASTALLDSLPVVVDLLRHPDGGVGALASEALSFLCDMHPRECGAVLLAADYADAIAECLQPGDGGFAPVPAVQEGILRALACLEPLPDDAADGIDANAVAALVRAVQALGMAGSEGGAQEDAASLAAAAEHAALALHSVLEGK